MNKYAVVGGQYQEIIYGYTDSLHAAKLLATKNEEYWDNWQGWHKPRIYMALSDEKLKSEEYPMTYRDITPLLCYSYESKRWYDPDEDVF